jgi:anti-sigma factor RsiW
MNLNNQHCQNDLIAAYLDGELDAASAAYFEEHVASCESCHAELNAQRLFMNDLDLSLASTPAPPLPKNFAQIVAARAESDMGGVRSPTEHKLALRFCVILALMSFGLLGVAAIRSVFFRGESIANKALGVFELLWTSLHDAALGLIVIARVIAQGLIPESRFAGLGALLLALAVVLLSLLISSYHRHRETRLIE